MWAITARLAVYAKEKVLCLLIEQMSNREIDIRTDDKVTTWEVSVVVKQKGTGADGNSALTNGGPQTSRPLT